MNDASCLTQNLPIGSGVTETVCKVIVKQRVCEWHAMGNEKSSCRSVEELFTIQKADEINTLRSRSFAFYHSLGNCYLFQDHFKALASLAEWARGFSSRNYEAPTHRSHHHESFLQNFISDDCPPTIQGKRKGGITRLIIRMAPPDLVDPPPAEKGRPKHLVLS